MPSVNERLQDEIIKRAIILARLRNGEARKIGLLLERAIPGILKEIEKRARRITSGTRLRSRRQMQLEALAREVQLLIRATGWVKTVSSDLSDVSLTESSWVVRMMSSTVPTELGLVFSRPTVQLLRTIVTERPFEGALLRDWASGLHANTATRIQRTVANGLVRGDDIATITRAARGQLNIARHQMEAVVRTAVTHVSSAARDETYEANSDIVSKVKWVATLDTRTSNICKGLDGKTFPITSGPRPPAHFNCRSTITPVLKSWKELGIPASKLSASTRASMDGQVSQDVTYGKWLRGQSAAVQNEALGPTRAAMFRRGEITVEDLADTNLRPLTIDELREL